MVGLVLAGLAAGAAWSAVFPPPHRATSAYVPRMEPFARPVSPVDFGFGTGAAGAELPSPEAAEGPDFYRWIARSEDILREAASRPVTVDGAAVPLEELYGVEGAGPADRRSRAVERLRERVDAERDDETGVVRVTVRARDPEVAVELNRRILDAVDGFVLGKRRERAERELAVLSGLLETARAERDSSVRAHERFLERNRDHAAVPALRLEEARLRRERELRERRVEALLLQVEERRAERARDEPMMSVVQSPTPEPPRRVRVVLLAVMAGGGAGLIAGVGAALALEAVDRRRERDDDAALRAREILAPLPGRK